MKQITFHVHNGLAGDLHQLLVGVDQEGRRISELFDRSTFPLWNLRRAKKKILKQFELLSGQTCEEK